MIHLKRLKIIRRAGKDGKLYPFYPVNKLMNGSGIRHEPDNPKNFLFPDPDARGVNRAKIGKAQRQGKPFPLVILKASHYVANAFFWEWEDFSITRRISTRTGKFVRVRSERREAIALLAATMIRMHSIGWGMCGKVDSNGDFNYVSLETLASQAGISYERAKEAFKVLREKGCVISKKIVEKNDDGTYSSRVSLKKLTIGFWKMIGFWKWIKAERKKRYKKRMRSEESGANDIRSLKNKRERIMLDMDSASAQEKVMRMVSEMDDLANKVIGKPSLKNS